MRATATLLVTLAMALAAIGLAVAAPGGGEPAWAQVRLASGVAQVGNSRAGEAVVTATGMRPGDSTSGTVTIGNAGDAAGRFSVAVTDVDGALLAGAVRLDVRAQGASAAAYEGPLGEVGDVDLGTIAPGEERTYEVRLTLPSGVGNLLQGAELSFGLTWRATTATAPPTPPAPPTAPLTPSTPSTPSTPAAPEVSTADAIGLPSAKRCVRRGRMRLRLRGPHGTNVVRAKVTVNGRVKAKLKGRKARKAVKLRGLKKRTKLKVSLKASDGRTYRASRTYRACKKR